MRHKRLASAGARLDKNGLARGCKVAARCTGNFMARSKAGTWTIIERRLAGTKTLAVPARGKTTVVARSTKATAKATTTMATVVTGTALHTLAVIETAGTTKVALAVPTTETTTVVAAKAATAGTGATAKLAVARRTTTATAKVTLRAGVALGETLHRLQRRDAAGDGRGAAEPRVAGRDACATKLGIAALRREERGCGGCATGN